MREIYQAKAGDFNRIAAVAAEHGFCLVKGVFTPEEMTAIEEDMKATSQDFQGNIPDLLSCPRLRRVMLDNRVLSTARALMGDDLVYYGESAVNYEEQAGALTQKPYNHLHFDARGMPDDIDTVWRSAEDSMFGAYRFAVYLRDYSSHSGGLKVAVSSHRKNPDPYINATASEKNSFTIPSQSRTVAYSVPDFTLFNVPSQPGDLVVWNLRTLHSAGARRLVDHPDLAMLPSVEDKTYAALPTIFEPIAEPRNALFFDYGAPVESTDLYIKNRSQLLTPKMLKVAQLRRFDGAAELKSAAANGVRLRFDPIAVLLGVELLTLVRTKAKGVQRPELEHAISKRRNRLLTIITRHEEYSPHHQLFDTEYFRRRIIDDADAGVLECAQVIIDQLQRQGADIVAEMPT